MKGRVPRLRPSFRIRRAGSHAFRYSLAARGSAVNTSGTTGPALKTRFALDSYEQPQEPANRGMQDHVCQKRNHERPNDMAPIDCAGRKDASEWGIKELRPV